MRRELHDIAAEAFDKTHVFGERETPGADKFHPDELKAIYNDIVRSQPAVSPVAVRSASSPDQNPFMAFRTSVPEDGIHPHPPTHPPTHPLTHTPTRVCSEPHARGASKRAKATTGCFVCICSKDSPKCD
jgi:hypothetical protein